MCDRIERPWTFPVGNRKMFNNDFIRLMTDMFSNPLFKRGFLEFYLKVQQEGIEAARRFWSTGREMDPRVPEIFERMLDFYLILGFVPSYKYERALNENEKLREENRFLKETLRELQSVIFSAGGKSIQESWNTIIDKQFELNREITRNFFELFRTLKAEPH
jgi:hypothetical protein